MNEYHLSLLQTARAGVLIVGMLVLSLVPPRGVVAAPARDDTAPVAVSERTGSQAPASDYSVYLPLIFSQPFDGARFGYGIANGRFEKYPAAALLGADWYVDWRTAADPGQHDGIEYVQIVRVHQKLTCPLWSEFAHDRSKCPYLTPHDYYVFPDLATITAAARANRGSLWLIGNEMDRRDFYGGGQDEILPELYARVYHDLYYHIKGTDPSARIAIGGVIQATPIRLEYLTRAWDAYIAQYGTPMPVDVWNVHNFILRENMDYGASIPPGDDYSSALFAPSNDATHVSMVYFGNQIRAFRQWMKDRGQQNKPLIVSEYGVLYPDWYVPSLDQTGVQNFMVRTFDFFLNTKDCSLGYVVDDCRLVQRWAWYSLDDDGALFGFNPYGALIDPDTSLITPTGIRYRDYVALHGRE